MRTPEHQALQGEPHNESTGAIGEVKGWVYRNKLAAALSGGLALAALDHPPVTHAAEIEPGATWEEGVALLKNSALRKENEAAAWFLGNEDGTWWVDPKIFEAKPGEIRLDLKQSITKVLEGEGNLAAPNAPVQVVCYFHTHNLKHVSTFLDLPYSEEEIQTQQTSGVSTLFVPPSKEDLLNFYTHQAVIAKVYEGRTENPPDFRMVVAAPSGIFYFGPLDNEEKKEDAQATLESLHVTDSPLFLYQGGRLSFINRTRNLPITFFPQQETLLHTVVNAAGYQIRFVSYDDIKNEPPCAGVAYTPFPSTNH